MLWVVSYLFIPPGQFSPKPEHNKVLPGDNFDQSTMDAIWSAIHQYHVDENPQDHAVYILNGGLGIANPSMMSWDSQGNMELGGKPDMFGIRELAESPAFWQTQKHNGGVMIAEGGTELQSGFSYVPWIEKHTKSGFIYYQWDMMPGATQFYFKEGDTYIVLKVSSIGNTLGYPFPEGVVTHLIQLGNPVQRG